MEERKRARKLKIKKRAWALTANESVRMRKLLRLMNVSILKAKHSDDGNSEYYQHLAWTAYGAYLRVKYMQGTSMKNEDWAPLMRLTAGYFSNVKRLIFVASFVC